MASRKVKPPVFKAHEHGLLVVLSRLVGGSGDALRLVKPETILGWHREGFRLSLELEVPPPKCPRAEEL